MPIAVEMPKMTDTMEEGVLVQWMVEEGKAIAPGDIIAQVETDKATMDVEAYDDGVLLKRVAAEGDALPIGSLIAVLGAAGEDIAPLLAEYKDGASSKEEVTASGAPVEVAAAGSGAVRASPLARKMAADHGLKLEGIPGSGPEGRIIKRDIEAHLRQEASRPTVVERGYTSVRISQMRKVIARRLAESKFTAPHFYLSVDVAMEAAVAARRRLHAQADVWGGPKISYNDLVTKACGAALSRHPDVNVSFADEAGEMRTFSHIDIGVAVAVDEGLLTPVVRDVDQKGLSEIATETALLAQRARDRSLSPEEMAGSTFTTSNLGMYGIEEFTAIINPPNACILAIGAIRDTPVVRNGAIAPGQRMKLTLSCDHRAVDGATGARFLATLRQYLEEPLTLLI